MQATVGLQQGGQAEIAYVLCRAHWGRGYGRQAVVAMLALLHADYGPVGLVAHVDPRNTGSVALLQGLGLVCVGVQADADVIGGEPADEATYRM